MAPGLPFVQSIAALPDPRSRSGRRYSLVALLSLAVAATLAGCSSYSAIAEWGRLQGAVVRQALGFSGERMPCAATFSLLFRRLDRTVLEGCLGRWAALVLAQLHSQDRGPHRAGDRWQDLTRQSATRCRADPPPERGQPPPGPDAGPGRRPRQDQRDHRHPHAACASCPCAARS